MAYPSSSINDEMLLRSYEESPKPETAVIVSLSQQLGLDPYIVRVWFTNR